MAVGSDVDNALLRDWSGAFSRLVVEKFPTMPTCRNPLKLLAFIALFYLLFLQKCAIILTWKMLFRMQI